MGILDVFFTKEERFEEEEIQLEERKFNLNINMMGISGIDNDKYTTEQVLSIPVAKACCDIIVNSIKTLKVEMYRNVDDNVVERIYDDYRLDLINNNPNLVSTGNDFKAQIAQDLVLHGNAYVSVKRDGNEISEMWVLKPSNVSIDRRVDPEEQ